MASWGWRKERARPPDLDGARGGAVGPRHDPHELGPPGPHQAGQAEDLAGPEGEGDALDVGRGQGVGPQDDGRVPGDVGARLRGVDHLAPDHHLDDPVHGGVGGGDRAGVLAVAQDGHTVGDRHDLVHPVGDVDDGHAAVAQTAHPLEQVEALGLRQGRGGLVEDEDLGGREGQGAGDLHQLGLAHAEFAQQRRRLDPDVVVVDEALGAPVELPVGDEQRARFAADEDVLGDGEVAHHIELLVDDRDPRLLGVSDGPEVHGRAVVLEDPGVVGVDARHDLEESRLARAVLADEGVNLPGAQVEGDPLEGLDSGEGLGDAFHPQPWTVWCHLCSVAE